MKTLFAMGECMEQLCVSQRTVQRYLENEELDKIIVKTKNGRKRYITVESVAKFIRKRSQELPVYFK